MNGRHVQRLGLKWTGVATGTTPARPTYFTKLPCVYSACGNGSMPLAVAQYLRDMAVRCSRMSRDCTDRAIGNELVQISVDLVEKAEVLEGYFSIAEPAGNPDDLFKAEIIDGGEDEKD